MRVASAAPMSAIRGRAIANRRIGGHIAVSRRRRVGANDDDAYAIRQSLLYHETNTRILRERGPHMAPRAPHPDTLRLVVKRWECATCGRTSLSAASVGNFLPLGREWGFDDRTQYG
jgi:hypothetical protein